MNSLLHTLNDRQHENWEAPSSWLRPVLVPNTRKCWTWHRKLQPFPHSPSSCPCAQQSHKKRHFISWDPSWPPGLRYHLIQPLQQQLCSFYAKLGHRNLLGPLHLLSPCLYVLSQDSLMLPIQSPPWSWHPVSIDPQPPLHCLLLLSSRDLTPAEPLARSKVLWERSPYLFYET